MRQCSLWMCSLLPMTHSCTVFPHFFHICPPLGEALSALSWTRTRFGWLPHLPPLLFVFTHPPLLPVLLLPPPQGMLSLPHQVIQVLRLLGLLLLFWVLSEMLLLMPSVCFFLLPLPPVWFLMPLALLLLVEEVLLVPLELSIMVSFPFLLVMLSLLGLLPLVGLLQLGSPLLRGMLLDLLILPELVFLLPQP